MERTFFLKAVVDNYVPRELYLVVAVPRKARLGRPRKDAITSGVPPESLRFYDGSMNRRQQINSKSLQVLRTGLDERLLDDATDSCS